MTLFFTSDLHLGHVRILELCNRPFDSVEAMNQAIIDRWNSVVTDEDTVFVLGDVAMGKIADSLPLVSQLKGQKHLISGNHDRCHPHYKKKQRTDIYYDAGFRSIQEFTRATINGVEYNVSHFPYEGDSHGPDRYGEYRLPDNGLPIIHGHVHGEWKVKGRQINVGVDVWDFFPVPVDRIAEAMIESS
jgi:calcineurin-like phosphoesterase family protein